MKEKIIINGNQYFQEILPLGCWAPSRGRKQGVLKRLLNRYQKEIDLLVVISALGLMFLAGIWTFLVELAEVGLSF